MNKLLLVEGSDDMHIMSALFLRFNIPKDSFKIENKEGINKLLESLPIHLKSKLDAIGILVDADENIQSRWDAIKNILNSSGYSTPKQPESNGTIIIQEGKATIGIWLMPNNETSGMIEDFMQFLIPKEDVLLPKAQKILADLESESINNYKTVHRSKALIHTWLSWQETPGTPMGLAITKSYFSTSNQVLCERYIDWIKELFK